MGVVQHGPECFAHRYIQVDVDLTDVRMRVQIIGPSDRRPYGAGAPRPSDYLVPTKEHGSLGPLDDTEHDVVLVRLYPDVLFADLRIAADAGLVTTLPPVTWSRPTLRASAADMLALNDAEPRTPSR